MALSLAMMTIEAVIFDVDGTLIDSVDLHAQAWVDALKDFGYEIPFAVVRRQIGKGGDHLLPALLPSEVVYSKGKELEAYRRRLFKERYLPVVTAFPCVRELLARIFADGTLIALGSSANADELEEYKRIANIADLIDAATSSSDAANSKPDPDIFRAALHRLGKGASQALVVGDTPYDAQAAAKAGLRCIGLLSGGWSQEELIRAGCFEIYADPKDLLTRYEQSALAPRDRTAAHVNGLAPIRRRRTAAQPPGR